MATHRSLDAFYFAPVISETDGVVHLTRRPGAPPYAGVAQLVTSAREQLGVGDAAAARRGNYTALAAMWSGAEGDPSLEALAAVGDAVAHIDQMQPADAIAAVRGGAADAGIDAALGVAAVKGWILPPMHLNLDGAKSHLVIPATAPLAHYLQSCFEGDLSPSSEGWTDEQRDKRRDTRAVASARCGGVFCGALKPGPCSHPTASCSQLLSPGRPASHPPPPSPPPDLSLWPWEGTQLAVQGAGGPF